MALHREHLPEPLPPEPLEIVAAWLEEATRGAVQPNPNALTLATVGADGRPSARVVLCKALRPQPGYLTFFSNYESRKGQELAANPRAAAVMHWDTLRRQVRIEGRIQRSTAAESDAYFASRAWQSRLGAWASEQSAAVASRAELEAAVARAAARFGAPLSDDATAPSPGLVIPRPPHWGGYRLWADTVELWVEGSGRIHDRARWTRDLNPRNGTFAPGPWSSTRLQP